MVLCNNQEPHFVQFYNYINEERVGRLSCTKYHPLVTSLPTRTSFASHISKESCFKIEFTCIFSLMILRSKLDVKSKNFGHLLLPFFIRSPFLYSFCPPILSFLVSFSLPFILSNLVFVYSFSVCFYCFFLFIICRFHFTF